jgi:hypothetical protein
VRCRVGYAHERRFTADLRIAITVRRTCLWTKRVIGRAQAVAAHLITAGVTIRARRTDFGATRVARGHLVIRVYAQPSNVEVRFNLVQRITADLAGRRVTIRACRAGMRAFARIETNGFLVIGAADLA